MALLRCHGDSDCNKNQDHKTFLSLYNTVVVIFFPYLYSWRRIVNAQTWEVSSQKNSVEPP